MPIYYTKFNIFVYKITSQRFSGSHSTKQAPVTKQRSKMSYYNVPSECANPPSGISLPVSGNSAHQGLLLTLDWPLKWLFMKRRGLDLTFPNSDQ